MISSDPTVTAGGHLSVTWVVVHCAVSREVG